MRIQPIRNDSALTKNYGDQLKSLGYEAIVIVVKDNKMSYTYTENKYKTLFFLELLKRQLLNEG